MRWTDDHAFGSGPLPKIGRDPTGQERISVRVRAPADREVCVIGMRQDRVGTSLVIDPSRCEREVRLVVALPMASVGLAASAAEGSCATVAVRLELGQLSRDAQGPLHWAALVENDAEGRFRRTVALARNIRPRSDLTSFEWQTDITLEAAESRWELQVQLKPVGGPIAFQRATVSVEAISSPAARLGFDGRRIEGLYSADVRQPALRLSADNQPSRIIAISPDLFELRSVDDQVAFSVDLSDLLPERWAHENQPAAGLSAELLAERRRLAFATAPRVASQEAPSLPQPEEPAGPLATAIAALRAGRTEQALALLAALGPLEVPEHRAAVRLRTRALTSLRRCDEVVALFPTLEEPLRTEPGICMRFVESCIAIGQLGPAREAIEAALHSTARNAPHLRAQLYRFAGLLDDQPRRALQASLVAEAAQLRRRFLMLVQCAHDLATERQWAPFQALLRSIEEFDLAGEERARLAILRAQVAFLLGNHDAELAHFNAVLSLHGTAPIGLIDGACPLGPGNIRVPGAWPASRAGPLVSVIMSSFNSAATIGYAARSLLDQTYGTIELIIVDDASSDATPAIIRELAAADQRVRPILLPINRGTYVARNEALRVARGRYVTCQDSDDWAHPEKIAALVEQLERHSDLIATAVQHVRIDDQRGFQCRRDYLRVDASSLTYRRLPVHAALGFYDSIRAGGDTEFLRRIELVFGKAAVRYRDELLSVVLWSESTLSGGGAFAIDAHSGTNSAVRDDYWRSYAAWHASADDLKLPYPLVERPFRIPDSLKPVRQAPGD